MYGTDVSEKKMHINRQNCVRNQCKHEPEKHAFEDKIVCQRGPPCGDKQVLDT